MPRIRVAILVSLLLAGSARAQVPGDDVELLKPTPMAPERIVVAEPSDIGPVADSDSMTSFAPAPSSSDWSFWARADYALAGIKSKPLPPLATTSPPGTGQLAAGVI